GRVFPGIEMAPADQALVVAPPGALLVLRPGDDPRRAIFGDRQRRRIAGLAGDEDQLPAHVLAGIVALRGAGANVDQLRLRPSADAVLRENNGVLGPGGDPLRILPGRPVLPLLPKLGEACVPAGAGALGAVEDLAVRRQGDDLHLLEAILVEPVA